MWRSRASFCQSRTSGERQDTKFWHFNFNFNLALALLALVAHSRSVLMRARPSARDSHNLRRLSRDEVLSDERSQVSHTQ